MAMTKQFVKTQWNNDREPAITAEQLNRMEKGIDVNDTRIVELDKTVTANKTAGDKSLAEVNKTLQKHTEDITAVNNELTSQGKAIGELADKKITKFYASSQGESTLNDSDNGKMQDMMLYGKSEQKQYSGKNLLNATLQTTTQGGVTCTNNGDGTYTLSGTATANAYFHVSAFTFNKGANYRLIGCPKGGNMDTKYGLYVDQIWAKDNGQGVTFSANQTLEEKIVIVVVSGNSINNLVFKPMLVDADTYPSVTYDDFEPYVGGIPSPNPDYPQEIKSVVEPVVKVTGKNLLNIKNAKGGTDGGITVTVNKDGSYTYVGTATSSSINVWLVGSWTDIANLTLSAGTYFIKGVNLYFNRKAIFTKGRTGGILTVSQETKVGGIRVVGATIGESYNETWYPIIALSDIEVPYEPYREQSVTLTGITLNAIPVSSGGNVTIDGQQYISDYVDVERGKIVRMVRAYLLPATFLKNLTGDYWIAPKLNAAFNGIVWTNGAKQAQNALCKSLKFTTEDIVVAKKGNFNFYVRSDGTPRIFISKKIFSTVDELNTFLTENSVYFYYILATPTEESLSEELAEKLKALQTYYSQTNIFITSNQLDGYAIFNYPISLANGWNYVKQQIGDTRDYIYDMDLQSAQAYVNSEYAVALTELEV